MTQSAEFFVVICAASDFRALSMKTFARAATVILGLALAAPALAGHPLQESENTEVLRKSAFDKGSNEFEVLAGGFSSFHLGNADRPDFDIVTGTLRMGWMLNTPEGEGLLRGNFEFLVEVFGGGVINGPGNSLFGGSVLLRYNFVQPEASLVPYFQVGGAGSGMTLTRIVRRRRLAPNLSSISRLRWASVAS
jgi:hypothetical protein